VTRGALKRGGERERETQEGRRRFLRGELSLRVA